MCVCMYVYVRLPLPIYTSHPFTFSDYRCTCTHTQIHINYTRQTSIHTIHVCINVHHYWILNWEKKFTDTGLYRNKQSPTIYIILLRLLIKCNILITTQVMYSTVQVIYHLIHYPQTFHLTFLLTTHHIDNPQCWSKPIMTLSRDNQ